MATSCNTHDYDGQLQEKWFQMRPMLVNEHLPHCLSFEDTLKDIERWLDEKYFNVKRIGRARRSLTILATRRQTNFDRKNEIDVEELLPILWKQVRDQKDIHDTFYEQLCDITGGSCSQGRSTRLFQFLFLFDLPSGTTTTDEQVKTTDQSKEPNSTEGIATPVVAEENPGTTAEELKPSVKESIEEQPSEETTDSITDKNEE